MRHRKNTPTLDRKKGPRASLLRNLTMSVLLYEKVKTTRAKARAVRPLVERAITIAKAGTLADRRRLTGILYHPKAVKKIVEVLGPRYKERTGGYTRTTALGQRQGDGAEIVQIELV
ncbi:50S ribosomal protein L17 [Candidatus Uhrbacteria bacterium]|nr:50S ribosomal protein L17 [Candidatus Uhrbacteria bacterium]